MSRARTLVLPLIALMISLGGLAWATIPSGNGTVHGCFDTQTGALRVIDADASAACASGEQGLNWVSSGPRGRTGATGFRGPTGPSGPRGQRGLRGSRGPTGPSGALPHEPRIRFVSEHYHARGSYRAYATCRPNEEALAGGALLAADPYNHVVAITASYPGGTNWVVDVTEQAALDGWGLDVYAECWRKTP
ncbi:MAG: hypothetical protein ACJ764_02680 [Solirubrobacteraceae bacterium]